MKGQGEILIYETEQQLQKIEVRLEEASVWLEASQISELYQTTKQNIGKHIKKILSEEELLEANCSKTIPTLANDGKQYQVKYYNLDMIIALGYRITSPVATKFRKWATECLKEYMIKGFTMDDERLQEAGGGSYWKELLERIRNIRSSEKMLYRQVLDLYATSMDYNPKSEQSRLFFQIVQNKLHYAAHGNTAAEVIFNRADSEKEYMGLRVFKREHPTLKDALVAKNYLDETELKVLNNLVSAYFDLAELNAVENRPMYMADYLRELDNILSSTGRKLLEGKGKVSHEQALDKARTEYRKWEIAQLSPVEQDYLASLKAYEKQAKQALRKNKKKS